MSEYKEFPEKFGIININLIGNEPQVGSSCLGHGRFISVHFTTVYSFNSFYLLKILSLLTICDP